MTTALLILGATNLGFLAGCWWANRNRGQEDAELFVAAYDHGWDDASGRMPRMPLPHRVAQRRAVRESRQ